jgi:hypothetical protein
VKKIKKDSYLLALSIFSFGGTIISALGISMKDVLPLSGTNKYVAISIRFFCIVAICVTIFYLCLFLFRSIYKKGLNITIGGNCVSIRSGDIFKESGLRVIPVDTCFQTTVDDKIIARKTLHGQLVLQHGNADFIKHVVDSEAKRRKIKKGMDGNYSFEFGTAIPYDGKDGKYIMVALIELDSRHEAHTNTAQFENTLINVWHEISRVYAQNPVVLPVFGSGIARFDDTHYSAEQLVIIMLRMLKRSKVQIKSKITIVLHSNDEVETILSLYEHKRFFEFLR